MSVITLNEINYVNVKDVFKKYKSAKKVPKSNIFIEHLNLDTTNFAYVSISKKNGVTILDNGSRYKSKKLFISNKWVEENDTQLHNYFDKLKNGKYLSSQTSSINTLQKLKNQKRRVKKRFLYLVTSPLINAVKVGVWSSSVGNLISRYRVYYGKDLLIYIYIAEDSNDVIEKQFILKFQDQCLGGELFNKHAIQDYKSYLKECTKNECFQPIKGIWEKKEEKTFLSNLPVSPDMIHLSYDDCFRINGKRIDITIRGDRSLQYTFFRVFDIGKTFKIKRLKDNLRNNERGRDYVYFLNYDVSGKKDTKSNNNKVLYFTLFGLIKFLGRLRESQAIRNDFLNWIITNVICENDCDGTTEKLKLDLQNIYKESLATTQTP